MPNRRPKITLATFAIALMGACNVNHENEHGAVSAKDSADGRDGAAAHDPLGPNVDGGADALAAHDPLKSIDTGTDPVFPIGDVSLVIAGTDLTVSAPRTVQTAAGVYTSSGALVRTLWRRRIVEPNAPVTATWDGKDDFGDDVPDGAYSVKVLAHNVAYKWQGVIGNTSHGGASAAVAQTVYSGGKSVQLDMMPVTMYRAMDPLAGIAVSPNGRAYVALGYNEQQTAMGRFESTQPQVKTQVAFDDFQRVFSFVTVDRDIAYYANTGLWGDNELFFHPENFIVGIRVSDDQEAQFANGEEWTQRIPGSNRWTSVIDAVPDGIDGIRGLVVDPNGDNLYVSHAKSGVRTLDKKTGACKTCDAPLVVPDPSALALAPNGDLWVVSGGKEVRKYTSPGTSPQLATTIDGFENATAIAISPTTSTLVVVDAGRAEQQLKAFDTQTGAPRWVHGKKGGYDATNGPDVVPNKLNFAAAERTYVAFEPGPREMLWVGEAANHRTIRFELPANPGAVDPLVMIDQIMFSPRSYSSSVDMGNPTRVFNGFLEFAVDYSKPIAESWKLVRNWDTRLPAYFGDRLIRGFRDVYTTQQGRTYATITSGSAPGHSGIGSIVVELTASGLRDTGVWLEMGTRFGEALEVRYAEENGDAYTIRQRDVTSIDASGNPVYGAPTKVAEVTLGGAGIRHNPVHGPCAVDSQETTFPKTSTGVVITFDPCAFSSGSYDPSAFHLGGIASGANDFSFRASPGGAFKLLGDGNGGLILDGDGTFNTDRLQENYAASIALTAGRHVVYNYFGEFWNNGQANQWMHWLDNGLFIGQFGTPNYPDLSRKAAPVGAAGNTFTTKLVTVDGNVYVYHNDENAHGGVHRWRIANLQSMQEMVGNIGKNTAVQNPPTIVSTAVSQQ